VVPEVQKKYLIPVMRRAKIKEDLLIISRAVPLEAFWLGFSWYAMDTDCAEKM
jgi:hypothetical protein